MLLTSSPSSTAATTTPPSSLFELPADAFDPPELHALRRIVWGLDDPGAPQSAASAAAALALD